jgi:hypothetical protein
MCRSNGEQQAVFVDVVKSAQNPELVIPSFVWFETVDNVNRILPQALYFSSRFGRSVSVRFWPSCVEGMQLLGTLRFCWRVDLVGENVVGVSPGDGEIQTGQQLCQRFTCSAFQHRQGVSSLVGHCDTFRERRNDSDADSALFDCLFDVGEVWKTAGGSVRGGVFV